MGGLRLIQTTGILCASAASMISAVPPQPCRSWPSQMAMRISHCVSTMRPAAAYASAPCAREPSSSRVEVAHAPAVSEKCFSTPHLRSPSRTHRSEREAGTQAASPNEGLPRQRFGPLPRRSEISRAERAHSGNKAQGCVFGTSATTFATVSSTKRTGSANAVTSAGGRRSGRWPVIPTRNAKRALGGWRLIGEPAPSDDTALHAAESLAHAPHSGR